MKTSLYSNTGTTLKEIDLTDRLFAVPVKSAVVHQVVIAQQANARVAIAHTKDRSAVRGGGRKPWKQKGTGRARHGSIRSPQWRGGGIVFGPTSDRNFTVAVNKTQKQVALAMCLSDKLANERLFVFETISSDGKTKSLVSWLKQVTQTIANLAEVKKVLVVMPQHDAMLVRAALNVPKLSVVSADSLNCVALLTADAVLTSEAAIAAIDRHYTRVKAKPSAVTA